MAVACLAPIWVAAQTRDLGAVKGHVQDTQGAAIQGVSVEISNPATGFSRTTQTDAAGNYAFSGIPLTGRYTISVKAPKFRQGKQENVQLRAGVTARLDFTLGVEAEALEVNVYGAAGGISTDSNQIGTRLDLPQIENTPILNNRLTSLQLLDSSVRLAQTQADTTHQVLAGASASRSSARTCRRGCR